MHMISIAGVSLSRSRLLQMIGVEVMLSQAFQDDFYLDLCRISILVSGTLGEANYCRLDTCQASLLDRGPIKNFERNWRGFATDCNA
jgi:hypothetical protein